MTGFEQYKAERAYEHDHILLCVALRGLIRDVQNGEDIALYQELVKLYDLAHAARGQNRGWYSDFLELRTAIQDAHAVARGVESK